MVKRLRESRLLQSRAESFQKRQQALRQQCIAAGTDYNGKLRERRKLSLVGNEQKS